MALPILDGNQTSTTLATTVSGGAHYPNHIIASGTVTANSYITNSAPDFVKVTVESSDLGLGDYYLQRTGDRLWESSKDSAGGVVVGFDENNNQWGCSERENGNQIATNPDNRSSIPPITGWSLGAQGISFSLSYENPLKRQVFGTVTIGNSVTVGSLPVQLSTTTIGGTARLNVTLSSATTVGATVPSYGNLYGGSDGTNLRAILVDSSGRTTVTGSVGILGTPSVTMGAISGTVTANNPNGTLTTRFGSVTTANTAQITTAVTNSSRKYLLAQNISAGTVTIGIGFSPTTTQGIQLTAGAGITFDSFVPTGAIYWLGATTGATWTILEN